VPENPAEVTWNLVGEVREFNTGRLYAFGGQPITYAVFESGGKHYVVFIDHARYIEGCIELHFGNLDLVDNSWVLRAYDDHHYRYNGDAFAALRAAREAKNARGPHSGTSASGDGY